VVKEDGERGKERGEYTPTFVAFIATWNLGQKHGGH